VFTIGGLITAISVGLACVSFYNWYTLDTEKPDIKGLVSRFRRMIGTST
jgi:hypothetical protein